MIKNVSLKLFSSLNVECIGDQEPVCQTLQLLQWRVYWWSRTCLSKSSASLMDGIFVIKNMSVNLFSSINGEVLVIKNVSVKLFRFINGGYIRDQDRACQALQLLQWRVYSWSRTCLSNSSTSLMEGLLMIKNVSVKLFSFFHGGCIGDQERVCETTQFLEWRVYWWPRTCLSNSSGSSVEGVFVIKNVSVKLFSFINGECIGVHEPVCQTLQLLQWRVYWWSRTCLSNSPASSMEGVLVIKNVSVKLLNFSNGGCIGDQERVCQTLQFLQWREYLWSRMCLSTSSAPSMERYWLSITCLSNSSASLMEGIFVTKTVSVKRFSFFNGGYIHDQERVCQTLQLL